MSIQGGSLHSEVCHLVLVSLDLCMQRFKILLSTDNRVDLWGVVMKWVSWCVSWNMGKVRRGIPPIHGGKVTPFTT